MGGAIALSMAAARPAAIRRIVLMGTMGVAMALPPGLDTVWSYRPGVEAMREMIGLFAYNRALITDELVQMRYEASRTRRCGIPGPRCSRRRASAGWTTWRCPAPS